MRGAVSFACSRRHTHVEAAFCIRSFAIGQDLRLLLDLLLSLDDGKRVTEPFDLNHSGVRDTLLLAEDAEGKCGTFPAHLH